jgi:hypothetical protein
MSIKFWSSYKTVSGIPKELAEAKLDKIDIRHKHTNKAISDSLRSLQVD